MHFRLIANTTVFAVRVGSEMPSRQMRVTITKDNHLEWTYDQPSWGGLAWGSGQGVTYLWSARAIIVLPDDEPADPAIISVDEDLLYVFKVKNGWLLVCETSIRALGEDSEISRIELGEVVERAQWADDRLMIEDADGRKTFFSASGEKID